MLQQSLTCYADRAELLEKTRAVADRSALDRAAAQLDRVSVCQFGSLQLATGLQLKCESWTVHMVKPVKNWCQ